MKLPAIISELNKRILSLQEEIERIKKKDIPEHYTRPQRDDAWRAVLDNWTYLISDREEKIKQIQEQISVACEVV
jgi:DNA repair exonuclease SbcCD ATPase subunit